MDAETIRFLITASVGLVGAFFGFVAAFFAEPVKTYFQNRTKLRNLTVALYKEILYNYLWLDNICNNIEDDKKPSDLAASLMKQDVRAECYKQALENELTLFYQLDEASILHKIYGALRTVTQPITSENLREFGRFFVQDIAEAFHIGVLNRKLLKTLANPLDYEDILQKGKLEWAKIKIKKEETK